MQGLVKESILSIVFDMLKMHGKVELADIYGGIMSGALSAIGTIAKINADDPEQTVENVCTQTYYQVKNKEEE